MQEMSSPLTNDCSKCKHVTHTDVKGKIYLTCNLSHKFVHVGNRCKNWRAVNDRRVEETDGVYNDSTQRE